MTILNDLRTDDSEILQHSWLKYAENLAIELARFTLEDRETCSKAALDIHVSQAQELLASLIESHWERLWQAAMQKIIATSFTYIDHFHQLTALQISEAQKHHQQMRQQTGQSRLLPFRDDIARRVAHMTVMNWRVWGDIAYLAQPA